LSTLRFLRSARHRNRRTQKALGSIRFSSELRGRLRCSESSCTFEYTAVPALRPPPKSTHSESAGTNSRPGDDIGVLGILMYHQGTRATAANGRCLRRVQVAPVFRLRSGSCAPRVAEIDAPRKRWGAFGSIDGLVGPLARMRAASAERNGSLAVLTGAVRPVGPRHLIASEKLAPEGRAATGWPAEGLATASNRSGPTRSGPRSEPPMAVVDGCSGSIESGLLRASPPRRTEAGHPQSGRDRSFP
jgi:hypothetical protein